MHANSSTIISTPAICHGFKSEGMMKKIVYAQFSDFIQNLHQIINKIEPPYTENPIKFYDRMSSDKFQNLLTTFDSALNIFSTIIHTTELSHAKTQWITSSIFASAFTNYMKMISDFLSHEFTFNSIFPFIASYSILDKYFISILCKTEFIYDTQSSTVLASQFRKAWTFHFSIFSNLTNLITAFDFPTVSQRIENIFQMSKSTYNQDEKLRGFSPSLNDLFFIQKSIKDQLLAIDENTSLSQIENIITDCQVLRESIATHDHTQMINTRYQTMQTLIAQLELFKAFINIKENAIRINAMVNSDNFTIDPADFATKDVQYVLLAHAAKSTLIKLNIIGKFPQSAPLLRKSAHSFYQAMINNHNDLTETFDRLAEQIHGLSVKIDEDYEENFLASMKSIDGPENAFESFKNSMIKSPVTIEDHSQRIFSFIEFEWASKLDLNESNEINQFQEYLLNNLISADLQEQITIFEQQVPQVEGNLGILNNESKLHEKNSYARNIILNLHQMIVRHSIPKRSQLFIELFTIFMEFVEFILGSDDSYLVFGVIAQTINFPSLDLIQLAIADPFDMTNLKVLIAKIQMCQEEIGVWMNTISDPQIGERIPSLKESHENLQGKLTLLSRCDEYIKELFITLNTFKTKSTFFSLYSRFLDLIGQQSLQLKINQNIGNELHPQLVQHTKIFTQSLLSLMKSSKYVKPFLKFGPSTDLYSSILKFLKVIFYNENASLVAVFTSLLDALPSFDFSSSLRNVFIEIASIEMILLSSHSNESMNQSIRDYRSIVLLLRNYIFYEKLDCNEMNSKIDTFLATFYYVSPKLFEKIEEHFTSITSFIKQLSVFKKFLESAKMLISFFHLDDPSPLRNRKYELRYFDLIFRNFILTCMKTIKKISKSDFVQQDIIDYLNNFSTVIDISVPPFTPLNYIQLAPIYEAFMNLYNSSVAFYQFSFIPSQSPNQESKLLKADSGVDSYWFLHNFDFLSHLQPLFADLLSIITIADDQGRNMKFLTKMNKMIDDRLHLNEKMDNKNVCLFKLAFALKFKKLLEKVNFDSPISQCQYIDTYNQIQSLIQTEINIVTLNFSLVATNLIINEKIKENWNIISHFSFTKCSPVHSTSEENNNHTYMDDTFEKIESKLKSLNASTLNGAQTTNHGTKKAKKFNFARKIIITNPNLAFHSKHTEPFDPEHDHEISISETFPIFYTALTPAMEKTELQATSFNIPLIECSEKCQKMLDEIHQFMSSSSRWIHNLRDQSIPLVPLHTAAEEVVKEINIASETINEKIASFSLQNHDIIEEYHELLEKLEMTQNLVKEKQKELFERKRTITRTKNVTLYKYAIMLKEFEKKKHQNIKKRIELEKLESDKSSMNLDEDEDEDQIDNLKFVFQPYQPVVMAYELGPAILDETTAQKELNEILLENEQLRNELRMSNSALQAARHMKDNKIPNHTVENQEKNKQQLSTDVCTRFFKSIKNVRSLHANFTPISDEVDINQFGESLLASISDFRKKSTESREAYVDNSYQLLKKLDKMISIYRAQKERTKKLRETLQEAKMAKDQYKSALSRILDDEDNLE